MRGNALLPVRIEASSLALASSHLVSETHFRQESLSLSIGGSRPVPEPPAPLLSVASSVQPDHPAPALDDANADEHKLILIKAILEKLLGRKIRMISVKDLLQQIGRAGAAAPPAVTANREAPNFSLEYHLDESQRQIEQTTFSAKGTIRTTDGKEIAFKLNLEMKREFSRETHVDVLAGEAARKPQDPLVITFDGPAAALSGGAFNFDLDGDGADESLPLLGSGGGFLALDRNGDERINNGTEFFGPATGNGFAELAAGDADHNGWIDEGDPIYGNLRIWSKDTTGKESLASLKERGVAAISLAQVATPFDLRDSQNALLGQVRSTGIYLTDHSLAGAIQQLDLMA